MRYIVTYDTQIAGKFYAKGSKIDFPQGTDEGFIRSLLIAKTIQESKEAPKKEDPKPKDEKLEELESETIQDEEEKEETQENLKTLTREELEAKAQELGIKIQANMKDETIIKKIKEASDA